MGLPGNGWGLDPGYDWRAPCVTAGPGGPRLAGMVLEPLIVTRRLAGRPSPAGSVLLRATASLLLLFAGGEVRAVHAQRACPTTDDPSVASVVRNHLEAFAVVGDLSVAGERVRARVALPAFYGRRAWAPAWTGDGRLSPCAEGLLAGIADAESDGLEPEDYHLEPALRLVRAARDGEVTPEELAHLDLLLTDAFLTLGAHLLHGRVDPERMEADWLANRRQRDMGAVLEAALAQGDVAGTLAALRPTQPGYRGLRSALAEIRAVAADGGWGTVPAGAALHPGDDDPRVPAIRRRLAAAGDLGPGGGTGTLYDAGLAAAVARFQHRHGLDADSVTGARTLAALNVPAEARARQVAVNLERWRWLPDDLGRTHIRVNIADYRVEVREGGEVQLEMRAVVGRDYRQTPMFSGSMTYLVLAPYWHVPPGIAAADKLPEVQRNPGYLAAQRMVLLDRATQHAVDPATVDFAAMSGAEFNRRYRLRQDPGPLNALGRVKFMFPNRHNVYLHDTPSPELFLRTERAFSSGCIRLERPMELADFLLRGNPEWPPERIRSVAAGAKETPVLLAEPVPTHLLYWTAFVDGDGRLHFRPDLYDRDPRVRRALEAEPPEL